MSASTGEAPLLPLGRGEQIPQIGFGVFKVPPGETEHVVAEALEVGYRHIDTAAMYGNEAGVGAALRASGLSREEIFITTKLNNPDHGYEAGKRALRASLSRLQLEQVDLYLIHWPQPDQDRYAETWRALIELQQEGLTRSIGVSNFQPAHLERIIAETGVTPAINQIELHPYLQQDRLRREDARLGILTEAWSPIARGAILEDPVILRIAEAHGRSAAQVVLRWHIQLGNVVIPKSVTPARIRENFQIFDFELTDEDMKAIGTLDAGRRVGPDPDTFG